MRILLAVLPLLLILAGAVVFVGSCMVAASDAQGAIVFIFSLPIVFGLLIGAFIVTLQAKSLPTGFRQGVRATVITAALYLVLFILGAFVPVLGYLTSATMNASTKSFKLLTGKTPYEYVQAKNDVQKMIDAELIRTNKQEIDFSKFETGMEWDKICILGPYTNNEVAKKVLDLNDWNIEMYSSIAVSDSINALIFVDSPNKRVAYAVEYPRAKADFAKLSGQCFGKNAIKVPEN